GLRRARSAVAALPVHAAMASARGRRRARERKSTGAARRVHGRARRRPVLAASLPALPGPAELAPRVAVVARLPGPAVPQRPAAVDSGPPAYVDHAGAAGAVRRGRSPVSPRGARAEPRAAGG